MSIRTPSSESFSLRRATADDSAGILECLSSAFAPFRESYSERGFVDTILTPETINDRLQEMVVFIAVQRGRIIGTIGCKVNESEGHLRGMAVRPEWQGSSVGTELLALAEQEIYNAGCSTITLDTTEPLKRERCDFTRSMAFGLLGRLTISSACHCLNIVNRLGESKSITQVASWHV